MTSALIHSAARGYADAVEMLLRAGAKPGLMDMEGKNALDYAESAEFEEVVQMLSACDDGPSTFRGGAEVATELTEFGLTPRMSGGAEAPTPRLLSARGGATPRMTPRVPLAGEVSSRLTPRALKARGRARDDERRQRRQHGEAWVASERLRAQRQVSARDRRAE